MALTLDHFAAIFSGIIDLNLSKMEIFQQCFSMIDKEPILQWLRSRNGMYVKSEVLSREYRAFGTEAYRMQNYATALDSFNMSISYSPSNTVLYGLTIANRTVVLFQLKKYKECLTDIDLVLKSNYPCTYRYKIYIRQTLCFVNLKAYKAASLSIAKARFSLKYCAHLMTELKLNIIKEKIRRISTMVIFKLQQSQYIDVDTDEDELFIPSLKNGENSKYIDASTCVEIKYSPEKGRYVAAKSDIKKGDVLFVEEPYSTAAFDGPKRRSNYCDHCLKFTLASIPCSECVACFYCSETCKDISWRTKHRWLCPGEQRAILTSEIRLALGVIFRGCETGFKTTIEDEDQFGSKEDNYAYIDLLRTVRSEEILKKVMIAIYTVLYLKELTTFFDFLSEKILVPAEELYVPIGGILLKNLTRCMYNLTRIFDTKATSSNDSQCLTICNIKNALGVGLYVSSAILTHSCIANTFNCFYDNVKVIKAKKDIAKGTEITVSYLPDHYALMSADDRKEYIEKYNLECTCFLCSHPDVAESNSYACIKCRGPSTVSFNVKYAVCNLCEHKFHLGNYRNMETRFEDLEALNEIYESDIRLDHMQIIAKTIYVKYSKPLLKLYSMYQRYYLMRGDLKNVCAYTKKWLTALVTISDEEHYKSLYVEYTYFMVKYCNKLKLEKSPSYQSLLLQTRKEVSNCMDVLKFVTHERNVYKYFQSILELLNLEDDVSDLEDSFLELQFAEIDSDSD